MIWDVILYTQLAIVICLSTTITTTENMSPHHHRWYTLHKITILSS